MRDLTLDECELVNGGDIWSEICNGFQQSWANIFQPSQPGTPPQSLTNDQLSQLQNLCTQAIMQSGNGGTATVVYGGVTIDSSGYYNIPVGLNYGTVQGQQVCVINPSTGSTTHR